MEAERPGLGEDAERTLQADPDPGRGGVRETRTGAASADVLGLRDRHELVVHRGVTGDDRPRATEPAGAAPAQPDPEVQAEPAEPFRGPYARRDRGRRERQRNLA